MHQEKPTDVKLASPARQAPPQEWAEQRDPPSEWLLYRIFAA
jgi:hypothetical protein